MRPGVHVGLAAEGSNYKSTLEKCESGRIGLTANQQQKVCYVAGDPATMLRPGTRSSPFAYVIGSIGLMDRIMDKKLLLSLQGFPACSDSVYNSYRLIAKEFVALAAEPGRPILMP